MKKFIANIIRTTITYSKFLLMIMALSSSGSAAKADDAYTYLKCGAKYLQLTGYYIKSNYNIRTKKFLDSYKITKYGETWITSRSYIAYPGYIYLNRDTGEMSYSRASDSKKYPCKVIYYNELPRVNDEGKKF